MFRTDCPCSRPAPPTSQSGVDVILSIVIVSYNTRELLARCVHSVIAATDVSHEIIVADNASSDGSPGHIRALFPGVRVMELGSNLGFGAANNAAVKISSGELLMFLNSDTEIRPHALDRMVAFFQQHPQVGIAAPNVVYPDGRFQLAAGALPGLMQEFLDRRIHQRLNAGDEALRRRLREQYRRPRQVGWVTGGCLMIRRNLFTRLNGFDEEMFMYFEDKDLCKRALDLHWQVMTVPDAEIIHVLGGSSAGAGGRLRAVYRQSQRRYYQKHLGWLSNKGLLFYQAMSK
ncbi:MAG: N-acetylglucosaminyl-diphospho-decaprenol L-rhamnosyltransferase [bacterium ADurb.Bin478]|nr:MAG: N-acetylglucosaminyl-diphospho-decaprenol L-rhamnosyltransferase [bacterium ADurb.Bin478]